MLNSLSSGLLQTSSLIVPKKPQGKKWREFNCIEHQSVRISDFCYEIRKRGSRHARMTEYSEIVSTEVSTSRKVTVTKSEQYGRTRPSLPGIFFRLVSFGIIFVRAGVDGEGRVGAGGI